MKSQYYLLSNPKLMEEHNYVFHAKTPRFIAEVSTNGNGNVEAESYSLASKSPKVPNLYFRIIEKFDADEEGKAMGKLVRLADWYYSQYYGPKTINLL